MEKELISQKLNNRNKRKEKEKSKATENVAEISVRDHVKTLEKHSEFFFFPPLFKLFIKNSK